MANKNSLKFNIGFNVDKSALSQLRQELHDIYSMTQKDLVNPQQFTNPRKSLMDIQELAGKAEKALNECFNQKLNTMNLTEYGRKLKQQGTTLKDVHDALTSLGPKGQKAFSSLANTITGTNLKLKETNNFFNEIGKSLTNAAKWTMSYGVINAITNKFSEAYGYVKNLDESLNNIRIVTGKSADEMANFARQANKAAKQLGASTIAYTDAALIYYQQGLSDKESQARAEVTLKAANVTGQNAQEVSEQLTAVWNGYKVSAQEAEMYVDKLSAVAAKTAADLEELSTGMSKVASAANSMGVDVDELNAQLATIISVTRQAPESVGTALKTIYARMGDLKLGKTDEDGVQLGEVSSDLEKVGIKVLDATGNLREMGDVVAEVGNKWNSWNSAEQQAIAISLAGKRQYNNLIALFENWDMYEDALATSVNSVGALSEQNDIYLDSMEAHLQKLTTAAEGLYSSLFDNKGFNSILDMASGTLTVLADFVDTIGGIKTIAPLLLSLLTLLMSKSLANGMVTVYQNMKNTQSNAKQVTAHIKDWNKIANFDKAKTQSENILTTFTELKTFWAEMYQKGIISSEDYNRLQSAANTAESMAYDLAIAQEQRTKAIKTYQRFNSESKISDETATDIFAGSQIPDATPSVQETAINARDILKKIENNKLLSVANITKNGKLNSFINEQNIAKLEDNMGMLSLTEDQEDKIRKILKRIRSNISKNSDQSRQEIEDDLRALKISIGGSIEQTEKDVDDMVDSSGVKLLDMKQKFDDVMDPQRTEQKQIALQQRLSEQINNFAMISSGLVVTWQTLSNMTSIVNDESLSAGEKTSQLVQNLLAMAPAIGMMVPTIQKMIGAWAANAAAAGASGTAVKVAGWAASSGWAPFLAILVAIIAIVGIIQTAATAISNWYNKDAIAAEKAAENAKKLKQAYEDLKTAYENLQKSFEEYNKGKDALDEMVEGTKEWNDQVEKLNQQIKDLIRQYPELAKYVTNQDGQLVISEENQDAYLSELEAATNRAEAAADAGQLASQKATYTANATAAGRNIAYDEEGTGSVVGGILGGGVAAGAAMYGIANFWNPTGWAALGAAVLTVAAAAIGQVAGSYLGETVAQTIYGLDGEKMEGLANYFAENPDVIINKDSIEDALISIGEEPTQGLINALYDNKGALESLAEQAKAILATEQITKDETAGSYLKSFKDTQYKNASLSEQAALNRAFAILMESENVQATVEENEIFSGDAATIETNVKNKYADANKWRYNASTDTFVDLEGKTISEENLVDYDTMLQTVKELLAAEEVYYNGSYKGAAQDILELTNLAKGNSALEKAYSNLAKGKTGGQESVDMKNLTWNEMQQVIDETINATDEGKLDDLISSLDTNAEDFKEFIEYSRTENEKFWREAWSEERIGKEASNAINALDLDTSAWTIKEKELFGDLYRNAFISGDIDAAANMSDIITAAGDRGSELAQILAQSTSLNEEQLKAKLIENGFKINTEAMKLFFEDWEEISGKFVDKNLEYWQDRYKNDQKVLKDLQLGSVIDPDVYDKLTEEQKTYFTMMADGTYRLIKSAEEFYNITKKDYKDNLISDIQDARNKLEDIAKLQNVSNKVGVKTVSAKKQTYTSVQDAFGVDPQDIINNANKLGGFGSMEFLQHALTTDYAELVNFEYSKEFKEYQNKVRGGTIDPLTQPFIGQTYKYISFNESALTQGVATGTEIKNYHQLDEGTRELFKIASTLVNLEDYGISNELFNKAVVNRKTISDSEKELFETALNDLKNSDFSNQIKEQENFIQQKQQQLANSIISYNELNTLSDNNIIDNETYQTRLRSLNAENLAALGITSYAQLNNMGVETSDEEEIAKWVQNRQKQVAEINKFAKAAEGAGKSVDRLSKKEKDLTGFALVKSFAQKKAALDRQNSSLEKQIELEKQIFENDMKANAEKFGLHNFDPYEENAAAMIQDAIYKARKRGDEASALALEAWLEQYETGIKNIYDLEDSLLDGQRDALQAVFDGLSAEIQIDLDLQAAEKQLLEFTRDYLNWGKDEITNTIKTSMDALTSSYTSSIIDGSIGAFTQIITDPNATDASVDEAQKHIDEAVNQLSSMKENIESIFQAYLDAISAVSEAFDYQIDVLDNLNGVYDHYISLTELIYGEDAYDKLGEFYKKQTEVLAQQTQVREQDLALMEQEMAAVRAALGTEGLTDIERAKYEEYLKELEDQYMEALDNWYGAIEAQIQNIKDAFLNEINAIFSDLTERLAGTDLSGMKEEWELMQMAGEHYYDDVNRAYEISKFENKMRQSINQNSSLATQRKLNQVMNEELKKLREKDKLSKYDVERAQLMYDIELKKIALQEAQANKVKMRLRRDASGNYSYQFVSDADEISKTSQELADLQNQLYNLDINEYRNNLETIASLYEEYQQKIYDIYADNSLTQEEREKRIKMLTDEYDEILNEKLKDNEELEALFTTGIWSEANIEEVGGYYQTLANKLSEEGGFAAVAQDALKQIEDASKKADEAIGKLGDKADQKLPNVETSMSNIAKHAKDITEALTGDGGALNKAWTQITSQDFRNAITTFNNLADSIREAMMAYQEFLKEINVGDKQKWEAANAKDPNRIENYFKNYEDYDKAMDLFDVLMDSDTGKIKKNSAHAQLDQGYLNVLWFLENKVGTPLMSINEWNKSGQSGSYEDYVKKWLQNTGLQGFDTGGYTGAWGTNGRLAMLHEKELVLNKVDTANILNAVEIVRSMQGMLDHINDTKTQLLLKTIEGAVLAQGSQHLAQTVKIEAHFPNATDHSEIEQAFEELVNLAIQKANE